jgi:hypothetical protein
MTTVIVLLFIALASVGIGYGLWSKTLFIDGTVSTGSVDSVFVDPFTDDDNQVNDPEKDIGDTGFCEEYMYGDPGSCDPAASGKNVARKDKDVGHCEAIVDLVADPTGETLLVTIDNAYPSYYCTVFFHIYNNGTVPVKILGLSLGGPAIEAKHVTGEWTEIQIGQQIDPGMDFMAQGDLDLHVEQIAPQGSTLELIGKIQLVQWNEFALPWETCSVGTGPCVEAPEVSFDGNKVNMGVWGDGETGWQSTSVHGGAVMLTPAAVYDVTFDYNIFSWDAYVPLTVGGTGYWDSFSVSISSMPYWEMGYTDPVSLPFVRGGVKYGDGILDCWTGTETLSIPGNMAGDNYLTVVLDTGSQPHANHNYPSYGNITITSIVMDP